MTHDIITVGGGLGGSALAIAMARAGRSVLVLESETEFRDRVRGEQLTSWGVAEAKELGLYDTLRSSCAHEESTWDIYFGGVQVMHRDMVETTPHGVPNLTFYHPEMQTALQREAEGAGVEVRRGARVKGVEPGERPAVLVEQDGTQERIEASLVVGADGRNSMVRKAVGFDVQREHDALQIGGIIMDNCDLADDSAHMFFNPEHGIGSPIFPQGKQRARLYLITHADQHAHSGEKDLPAFLEGCQAAGVSKEVVESATYQGPLATFKGAATWVERPYKNGVALVGDSAGHSDPSWGQGLSLTLRDVRVLRDKLLETDDWDAAGNAYASEQNGYFMNTHTVESWFTRLFYDTGPEAEETRARVIPLMAQNPEHLPDHFQAGPESGPVDDAERKRMFAED